MISTTSILKLNTSSYQSSPLSYIVDISDLSYMSPYDNHIECDYNDNDYIDELSLLSTSTIRSSSASTFNTENDMLVKKKMNMKGRLLKTNNQSIGFGLSKSDKIERVSCEFR